jgi:hypothetical protein
MIKAPMQEYFSKLGRIKAVRVCGRLPKNKVSLFYYYIDYKN